MCFQLIRANQVISMNALFDDTAAPDSVENGMENNGQDEDGDASVIETNDDNSLDSAGAIAANGHATTSAAAISARRSSSNDTSESLLSGKIKRGRKSKANNKNAANGGNDKKDANANSSVADEEGDDRLLGASARDTSKRRTRPNDDEDKENKATKTHAAQSSNSKDDVDVISINSQADESDAKSSASSAIRPNRKVVFLACTQTKMERNSEMELGLEINIDLLIVDQRITFFEL